MKRRNFQFKGTINLMKNIQDLLSITCEIYAEEDMANELEFKSLMRNFEEVKNHFARYDFTAFYTRDIITDYFIVDKICAWNFSERVTPEEKEQYEQIKAYFGTIKSNYEIRKIVEFLKSFSFDKDDDSKLDFVLRLYDILPQYASSIKDESVFARAINAHPYLILDKFDQYKKVFNTYRGLYALMFSEKHIQEFLECRFDKFAIEVSKLCKKDGCIEVSLKEAIIEKIVELADRIIENTDAKQALVNQIRYKTILKFLSAISFPRYAEYLTKQKQVDALSEEWLDRNGQQLSYEMPVDDIKKQFDNPTIPWELKYIQLTHSRLHRKWQHFCAAAMSVSKHSLTEFLVSTNIDTNEHFGVMTQQMIGVYHNLHGFALQYFIRDPQKWQNFISYTYSIIDFIYDNFSISIKNIETEFTAWANKGAEYWFNRTATDLQKKDIAFTFTDKTVKLTEKILRTIYSEEMKKQRKFYDPDKITLGTILKSGDESNPLIEILSLELMQYLSFCLIKDEDNHGNKVGIGLRNLIEHDKYDWNEFNHGNGVLSLLVFVSTLNGFLIYYTNKKRV